MKPHFKILYFLLISEKIDRIFLLFDEFFDFVLLIEKMFNYLKIYFILSELKEKTIFRNDRTLCKLKA